MRKFLTFPSVGLLGSLRAMSRAGALTLVACTLLGSLPAAAAPAPGPELQKWRETSRFNVKTPYTTQDAGAARVNVDAPEGLVRSVVQDYGNYQNFMAYFKKSRIIGRSGDKTDVYVEVAILKGAGKIWAVVRFDPIKQVDGGAVLTGHMIKGNVKRLEATWRLKKLDDSATQVALELLILLDMPVPESLVVPELRFAAAKAVEGSRDEAEKRKSR